MEEKNQRAPSLHFSLLVAISIAVFYVFKSLITYITAQTASYGNMAEILLWVMLVAFVIFTFHVRMSELPAAMAIIFKYVFALFSVYLIFPLTLPSSIDIPTLTSVRLNFGHFMLPTLCIIGFWRPSVGVAGLVAAMSERISLSQIVGQTLSKTEYFPLVEVSLFMVISAALVPVCQRFNWMRLARLPMTPVDKLNIYEKLVLVAIAVHLSNYFYSGVKKTFLGEDPLSWALHNETWSLILSGFPPFPRTLLSSLLR